jgi:hypothetical protein
MIGSYTRNVVPYQLPAIGNDGAPAGRGNYPDVLDGAALQHPAEMDLAGRAMGGAVRRVCDDLGIPIADELAVKR